MEVLQLILETGKTQSKSDHVTELTPPLRCTTVSLVTLPGSSAWNNNTYLTPLVVQGKGFNFFNEWFGKVENK
jgi:hypothetical protein